MKRRQLLASAGLAIPSLAAFGALTGCAAPVLRGTGDLGVVIGRANGTLYLVDTSAQTLIGSVPGLGDLSHASVVFSRDGLYAYVFGRDGGLTQVNLLEQRISRRVMQAGNSIGGAISADGSLVAAQNYTPGGVKVFDARTLALVADIPAEYDPWCTGQALARGRPGRPARPALRLQPVRRQCDLGHRLFRPEAGHHAQAGERWPPALRRPGHARWPPLHRRPVRRRRPGHGRSLGRKSPRCSAS